MKEKLAGALLFAMFLTSTTFENHVNTMSIILMIAFFIFFAIDLYLIWVAQKREELEEELEEMKKKTREYLKRREHDES